MQYLIYIPFIWFGFLVLLFIVFIFAGGGIGKGGEG